MRIILTILFVLLINLTMAQNQTDVQDEGLLSCLENERAHILSDLMVDILIGVAVALLFALLFLKVFYKLKNDKKWCKITAVIGILTMGILCMQLVKFLMGLFMFLLTFFWPDMAYTLLPC